MLLAAVTPSPPPPPPPLLPPFLPVYRLVRRRNKQERAQRREDVPPSPPPPRYLPIFIQPFLSWRGIIPLQGSETWGLGRDGHTTDRPKQASCMEAPGHPTQTRSSSTGRRMAPHIPYRAMQPITTQEAAGRVEPGVHLGAHWGYQGFLMPASTMPAPQVQTPPS